MVVCKCIKNGKMTVRLSDLLSCVLEKILYILERGNSDEKNEAIVNNGFVSVVNVVFGGMSAAKSRKWRS